MQHRIQADRAEQPRHGLWWQRCAHRARINAGALCGALFALTAAAAWAHDAPHSPGVALESPTNTAAPLPLAVGGPFTLINHHGRHVSDLDYRGKYMLVFFGYINCKNMCSLSLSRIGQALELLGASVERLTPLVITVDPTRDTPAAMQTALAKYHPSLIGLTGAPDALKMAYQNYQQAPTLIGDDWENDAIISHSSYIYLLDPHGEFTTLFPPILNPQSMAAIIAKYVNRADGV